MNTSAYDPNAQSYVPELDSGSSAEGKRKRKKKEKSEFLVDMQYMLKIPSVGACSGKLQKITFEKNRLDKEYFGTSLEQMQKVELLSDIHLNMPLDMVDPSLYSVPEGHDSTGMSPEDMKLVKEESQLLDPLQKKGLESVNADLRSARTNVKRKAFHWLEKNKFLPNNLLGKMTVAHTISEKRMRQLVEIDNEKARSTQTIEDHVRLINQTFEDVHKIPEHPTNKKIKLSQVINLMPGDIEKAFQFTYSSLDRLPQLSEFEHLPKTRTLDQTVVESHVRNCLLANFDTQNKTQRSMYVPVRDESKEYAWVKEYVSRPTASLMENDHYVVVLERPTSGGDITQAKLVQFDQQMRFSRQAIGVQDKKAHAVESRPANLTMVLDETNKNTE